MQREGQTAHQWDVEAWDQAFAQEDAHRKAGTQSTPKKILTQQETIEPTSNFLTNDDSGYESAETKSTGDMFSILETSKTN